MTKKQRIDPFSKENPGHESCFVLKNGGKTQRHALTKLMNRDFKLFVVILYQTYAVAVKIKALAIDPVTG